METNILTGFLPQKQELEKMSYLFSCFSDVTRLKILSALSLAPMFVTELSVAIQANQTTVSHQLKIMKERGIVSSRRFGKMLKYQISSIFVSKILENGVDFFE